MVTPGGASDWDDCHIPEADAARLSAADPSLFELVDVVRRGNRPAAINALFVLKDRVCHQGMTIGSGTPLVLPTLVAVMGCRRLTARVELSELIDRIARASTAWRRAANDAGAAYADNYRERVAWEIALDRIFVDSIPQFVALSKDPSLEISRIASNLVMRYRSDWIGE